MEKFINFLLFNSNYTNFIIVIIGVWYYNNILWKLKSRYRHKFPLLKSPILFLVLIGQAIAGVCFWNYEINNMTEVRFSLLLLPYNVTTTLLMYWINNFHKPKAT